MQQAASLFMTDPGLSVHSTDTPRLLQRKAERLFI
jgi:hypothetical protein